MTADLDQLFARLRRGVFPTAMTGTLQESEGGLMGRGPVGWSTVGAGPGAYGDASDGDVTITADTTLTRDMYYDDLTVNATKTLTVSNYHIFVAGVLTNNGTVACNGGAGGNGGNAAAATPGTAGAAGAAVVGSIGTSAEGRAGVAGVYSSAAAGLSDKDNGLKGGNAWYSYHGWCDYPIGGAGGNGVIAVGTGTGGAGGPAAPAFTGTAPWRRYPDCLNPLASMTGRDMQGIAATGGSGGTAIRNPAGASVNVESGGSGGSGAAGGLMVIMANVIRGTGTFTALGGNGGNGGAVYTTATGDDFYAAGGSAGGNGGAGGLICLVYSSKSGTWTTDVSGGAAGTGSAGASGGVGSSHTNGANGNAGPDGLVVELQV